MASWRWSRIENFPLPWFILSSGNYSLHTCLGMKIFWPPHLFILSSEFGMLFGSSCGRSEPHTPLIGLGRRNIGFVRWVSFSSSDISLMCLAMFISFWIVFGPLSSVRAAFIHTFNTAILVPAGNVMQFIILVLIPLQTACFLQFFSPSFPSALPPVMFSRAGE